MDEFANRILYQYRVLIRFDINMLGIDVLRVMF